MKNTFFLILLSIYADPINAMHNKSDYLSNNKIKNTTKTQITKPKKICNQKRRLEDNDYREPSIDYSSKIKKELGDNELYLCLLDDDSSSDSEYFNQEDTGYYSDQDSISQFSNSSDCQFKNNNNYDYNRNEDKKEDIDLLNFDYHKQEDTKKEIMDMSRFFSMNQTASTEYRHSDNEDSYSNIDGDLLELENLLDQMSLGSNLMRDRYGADENFRNF